MTNTLGPEGFRYSEMFDLKAVVERPVFLFYRNSMYIYHYCFSGVFTIPRGVRYMESRLVKFHCIRDTLCISMYYIWHDCIFEVMLCC